MSDLIAMLGAAAGAAAGGGEVDPNFNQTVLLLHGDGTNGAQNNTFLDSSTNNFTITRNGNTTQGTFSPFSAPDGRWSNYFDGTGDYLTVPDDTALEVPTQDFTIEAWVYLSSLPSSGAQYTIIQKGRTGTSNFEYSFELDNNSGSMRLVCRTSSNGTSLTNALGNTISLTANQWNHCAVTRTGTNISFWFNGVAAGTGTAVATTYTGSATVGIGANDAGGSPIVGYMSNLRLLKGTAIDFASTGIPTSPLTAISGTSLLTCQSNRFVDNSSNAFAITRNGDTKVTPFGPFAPTAAYDASVNGGSGYFDGTGDYLNTATISATAFGTSAFTVEAWLYQNARSGTQWIMGGTGGALFQLGINSSGFIFGSVAGVGDLTAATTAVPLNAWTHVAIVRSSTSSGGVAYYINGAAAGTATSSTNFSTNVVVNVGTTNGNTGVTPFNGYIADFRIVKGSAVTPSAGGPTSPLTAVTNTSLLLNFTNAGIFDNTGKNNLETVGNAQIDTTTKKYGTGSMEFDGTEDYLSVLRTPDTTFGSGNFTIELWFYTAGGSDVFLFENRLVSGVAGSPNFGLKANNKVWLTVSNDGSSFQIDTYTNEQGSAVPLNEWVYLAVVRNGNTIKVYVNGVEQQSGSFTGSVFQSVATFFIGGSPQAGIDFNGFIDDLRITKGVARYTTTFTPPTKEFPNL